ncbi:MAG TPA: hypothetical protein VHY37_05605, partial [Tepidisphaeraceae bacterium]|nr:hypothetical protein [Tepidisphaeraceae bacterium]
MSQFEPVLVSQSMNAVTGAGFALIGLGMGLLVVLPDLPAGKWAFLTHRPIGRGRIFFGKFLAATTLYFFATALPMTLTTAWVVIPGDMVGPFVWQMLLPRLAHLLAGWAALAAGMLVAARKGRWIGSRLLPAGAAALAWGMVQNFSTVAPVFAVLSAALMLTLAAAYAAFVNGGEYESQPGITRVAQGLCILPGVGIVLLFAMVLPLPIVRKIGMGSLTLDTASAPGDSDYELANDGHVYQRLGYAGRVVVCVDDPRRVVKDYERSHVWAETMGLPFDRIQITDFNLFDARAYAQQVKTEGQTVWLYLPWQRAVVGYDLATRRYLGSLGPGGFRTPPLAPRPFPEPVEFTSTPGSHLLAMNTHSVWWLNTVPPMAAELAYTAVPGDPIIEVDDWAKGDSPPTDRRVPIVITRRAINFIDKGRAIARIPLVRNPNVPFQLSYTLVGDNRFATLYCYGGFISQGPLDYLLVQSDLSGKILSRKALPPPAATASRVETYIPGWDLEEHYYFLF